MNNLNFMIVGFNEVEISEDKDKKIKKHEIFSIRACINGVYKNIALYKDFNPSDLKDVLIILFQDLK